MLNDVVGQLSMVVEDTSSPNSSSKESSCGPPQIQKNSNNSNKSNLDNKKEKKVRKVSSLNDITKLGNDSSNVIVTFRVPPNILKDVYKNYKIYYTDKIWSLNEVMTEALTQYNNQFGTQHLSTSSLLFEGRKPRKDVILRLDDILDVAKSVSSFPNLDYGQLQRCIQTGLGNVDPRTTKKYLNCLVGYVENVTGTKTHGFLSNYNLSNLEALLLAAAPY